MPPSQPPPDVFLPHIDTLPTPAALASAQALIESELEPTHTTVPHPSLPPPREPAFSPLVTSAHESLASSPEGKIPWTLDLGRYELPELPSEPAAARREALRHASASAEYLAHRRQNLALLETYGKNAWLVSNSGLEDELRGLEREVEAARVELEEVQRERRARQEGAIGEMRGLEEGWRRGVGRMIEVLAAGERVKGEILEGKRRGAGGV